MTHLFTDEQKDKLKGELLLEEYKKGLSTDLEFLADKLGTYVAEEVLKIIETFKAQSSLREEEEALIEKRMRIGKQLEIIFTECGCSYDLIEAIRLLVEG